MEGTELTSLPRRAWHWWVSVESHSNSAWGCYLVEQHWCGKAVRIVSVREGRRRDGVAFLIPNR
jgi:hypothetical protein